MKNAASAAKKRSITEGAAAAAVPPAKRPRRGAPLCHGLTPELLGQTALFVPMGNPDMMRLLLCVGPDVAAIVRKMYLTANEYYLWTYMEGYGSGRIKQDRAKECIGYWMDYNEKAWKQRCLGKTHKDNAHSVMLTPEQLKIFDFGKIDGLNLIPVKGIDKESINALQKLAKSSPVFFLVSVGDRDVDDGRFRIHEKRQVIDSTPVNSDGKMCVRFMGSNNALFAYPQFFLRFDLVDVLRFQIEEEITEPSMIITSVDDDGDLEHESLLYLALRMGSVACFRYLLSLPGTDINADVFTTQQGYYENIIHSCLDVDNASMSIMLKDVLAHTNVRLDTRNALGETAFCLGCGIDDLNDQTITKLRMLLKAGADPRIEDHLGHSPLSNIAVQISDMEASEDPNSGLKEKVVQLREEISNRIQELNNMAS